jgi:di/tricarboxylate transporter
MITATLIWLIPAIVFYIIVRLQHKGLYWTLETRWDTIGGSLAWPIILLFFILIAVWELFDEAFLRNVNWNKDVKW